MNNLPYDYRKSQNRPPEGEDQPPGRRASYNARGRIRGLRSTPGANLSPNDSMTGLSIPSEFGKGLSDSGAWGSFFKGNSPTGVRMGYTANSQSIADAAYPMAFPVQRQSPAFSDNPAPLGPLGGTRDQLAVDNNAPSSSEYLGTVISSAKNWMKRFGQDLYG